MSLEAIKIQENLTSCHCAAAIQCLKRKRLYEQQVEQLGNFQLCIHDQMIMLEGAKATIETVDALRTGAATMKAMQKATNIDDVDKTMDEINEQTDNMKQIQDALKTTICVFLGIVKKPLNLKKQQETRCFDDDDDVFLFL
ncbi:vacuolar protein sorting-associated protein 32 homolog 1 [Brassica rapa]|uniref:vacuolar protein sorting-associated protein 32 homolog 1 n=1 Tax=Brassica campestris TaxID=3711 RepID=UPI00142E4D5B|nr:vacuolar protein sorting-associated protein 32 homolog 1 [Brassica rapa]